MQQIWNKDRLIELEAFYEAWQLWQNARTAASRNPSHETRHELMRCQVQLNSIAETHKSLPRYVEAEPQQKPQAATADKPQQPNPPTETPKPASAWDVLWGIFSPSTKPDEGWDW